MADPVALEAVTNHDMLWQVAYAVAGCVTRMCLLPIPQTKRQVVATLISGPVFAVTGCGLFTNVVPGAGTISIGLSAFFAGVLGVTVVELVMRKFLGFNKEATNDSAH